MTVNYHMTDKTITVTYAGKIRTVNRDTEIGDEVLGHIRADTLGKIPEIIDVAMKIQKIDPSQRFLVVDGEVYCKGVAVPPQLSQKMLKFLEEKLPIEIFLKFWENLDKNPLQHSKDQLFEFLENSHFPLTPDGCFIAYKNVKGDYKDMHTGKMDNSPGKVVKMPRDQVDHNPNSACSRGLHVGSYTFASKFGTGILIEVKVNPRDVVSVPSHDAGKCRCCEYTVIGPILDEHLVEVVPKKAPSSAKKAAVKKATGTIGAIATKKAAAEETPAENKSETPEPISAHLENIQIGPYAYRGTSVLKKALAHAATKGYNRVKPSKYPAALKTINAIEVFRKALTKTKYDYYLEASDGKSKTRTVFVRYQQIKIK